MVRPTLTTKHRSSPLQCLYLEMYAMQLLAMQIPDHDVSVCAPCSHAAVSRAEGNRVYPFRVCAQQSTVLEILNPAGFNRGKGRAKHAGGVVAHCCVCFVPKMPQFRTHPTAHTRNTRNTKAGAHAGRGPNDEPHLLPQASAHLSPSKEIAFNAPSAKPTARTGRLLATRTQVGTSVKWRRNVSARFDTARPLMVTVPSAL